MTFFFLLCLATAQILQPSHAISASGNVPLDSDVYRHLDLLTARGLLRSHLSGTRPITWAEAHRLLEEARELSRGTGVEGGAISSSVRKSIRNLEERIYKRFTGDIRAGTGPLYAAVHDPALVLENLSGDRSAVPGIKAEQHALVYNNGGIDPDDGLTASVAVEAEGALGPFHLQFFPRLTTADADRSFVHRGSLKIGVLGGLELNIAKESLWWGQGAHGGLYLTSNADPLEMIHFSTPHPVTLPWIFKYLGPCRLEFFTSRLEENRAVPEPYFLGLRTNFRPVYELEVGMTMMAVTGGEGRPGVSFGDLFDILFGENEAGGEDRSNNIAGIDLRLNLSGYQFYAEFGGEDEAGGLPSKMAGLLGFYYPGIGENLDLRIEYTDLAYTEEIAGVWYRHGIYTDGYTYDGRLLGHHVGGDGRDLLAEVTFGMGEGARGRVGVDLEWRGVRLQPAVERHTQVLAGLQRSLSLASFETDLDISAAVDFISNVDYVSGKKGTNGYLKIGLRGKL